MKKIIDWERAAKDNAPVWLWVYQSDKYKVATNLCHWNAHSAPAFNHKFKYAELIRPEDVKKYTVYEMERSDFKEVTNEHINFCKENISHFYCHDICHLGVKCPFTSDNIGLTKCWENFGKSPELAAQQFLDLFENDFDDKYRPCKSLEEFRKFMGKIAINKHAEREMLISTSSDSSWEDWFTNFKLIEPIDGSTIIGVKVD